jgi:hypothetical protein
VSVWERSAFVSTPENVPPSAAQYVDRLWVQVASGCGPPGVPLSDSTLGVLRASFQVGAWAWCVGPGEPGGGEPEDEARYHAQAARERGFTEFISNQEHFYDAHGNQGDLRYVYPRRYLEALDWDGPLGLTTTPFFGSDMSAWTARKAIFMPQAFTLENGASFTACVGYAHAWGWPDYLIRPLVQCYMTNGQRPDPQALNVEATGLGLGGIPYIIEQAMDDAGRSWLAQMQPTIDRPQQNPPSEGEDLMTLIGSQDGITAACNRLRYLDPQGTKLQQDGKGNWLPLSSLTIPVDQYGAWDKLQRSLQILVDDHDAALT